MSRVGRKRRVNPLEALSDGTTEYTGNGTFSDASPSSSSSRSSPTTSSPRNGSPRVGSPRMGMSKPRAGIRLAVFRVASTQDMDSLSTEEVPMARGPQHFHWDLLMNKVLPIVMAIAILAILMLFFKVTGLNPTCEASPKRYVDHQYDEYRYLYHRVKDDLDHDTNFEGNGGEKCDQFVDWIGDTFIKGLYFFPTWILFLTMIFEDVRAAKTFASCALMLMVGWFLFSIAVYQAQGIRHYAPLDPIVVSVIAFFAFYIIKRNEFNGRGKYYILLLFPFGTLMFAVINHLVLSILVANLSHDEMHRFVISYPVILSLCEKLLLMIANLIAEIEVLTDEEMYPSATILVVFFESLRYAVAIYTFDEEQPAMFLGYLAASIFVDVIRRNRLLRRLVVGIASLIERRRLVVPERSRLDQGLYACKFEIEYLPLIFSVFVRVTQWIIIPLPGNHLNREGVADNDFILPYWFYLGMLGGSLIVDGATVLLAKSWRWSDIRRFEIRSWSISMCTIWYAMLVTVITILSTSATFYDYRFR